MGKYSLINKIDSFGYNMLAWGANYNSDESDKEAKAEKNRTIAQNLRKDLRTEVLAVWEKSDEVRRINEQYRNGQITAHEAMVVIGQLYHKTA